MNISYLQSPGMALVPLILAGTIERAWGTLRVMGLPLELSGELCCTSLLCHEIIDTLHYRITSVGKDPQEHQIQHLNNQAQAQSYSGNITFGFHNRQVTELQNIYQMCAITPSLRFEILF